MAYRGRIAVPFTVSRKNEWENKNGSCDSSGLGGGSVMVIDSASLIPLHLHLNPPGCHSELRHNAVQLRCKCLHHNDFPPNCHSFNCGLLIEHEMKAVRIKFFTLFHFIAWSWQDFYSVMIILPWRPIRITAVILRWMGEKQVLMIIWHFWNPSVSGLVNWLLEMINTSFFYSVLHHFNAAISGWWGQWCRMKYSAAASALGLKFLAYLSSFEWLLLDIVCQIIAPQSRPEYLFHLTNRLLNIMYNFHGVRK